MPSAHHVQDRVTDHRIGLSLLNLSSCLEGDGLQEFLDALHKNYIETILEEMVQDLA